MPKPLPAVGLASSIVQIIDFSINLLQKDHKIYHPTDGDLLENHAVLQDIAHNLFRLTLRIDENDLKRLSSEKKGKLSEAAEHLLKISDDAKDLTGPLIDAILHARAKGSYGDPNWNTARDALLTVWKKKDVTTLKKKLRVVRREVDTTLLLALRQYLDQSAETGLPVFSAEDARTHHLEKWQNKAMEAVHDNDWKPKNKKDVDEFSKQQVDSLITSENEAHFCQEMFAKLYSPVLNDRLHSISSPHEGTFEWVFDSQLKSGNNFLEWLGSPSGRNLFWITGKPGSGKSTLIKYLFRNPRLFPSLEKWSGQSPGILAGFFFWNSGTCLQKSPAALLRTLLYESLQDMIYGPLEQDPSIVQILFSDHWNQFTSYGGGMHDLTFPQLHRAFELMTSDATKKFFFIIDGLDEIDGYPAELFDLIKSTAKRENVKICASSRPLPVYQTEFEKNPTLSIDAMTNDDIHTYVVGRYDEDEKLAKIRSEESESKPEPSIVDAIIDKGSGDFLWARMAMEHLIHGTKEEDDLASFLSRVEALPSGLEDLVSYVFHNMEEEDLKQAARLFRLLDAHGYPSVLELSFANEADPKSGIALKISPLKSSQVEERIDAMRDLFRVQCKSFLTIYEASDLDQPNGVDYENTEDLDRLKVNYSHRCVRDFIQSFEIQDKILQTTGNQSFNPDEYWANASLWSLKTLRLDTESTKVWHHVANAMEYSLRLQDADGKCRVSYLDEVGRAAVTAPDRKENLHTMDYPPGPTLETFLDLAVWLNLQGYTAIKAKEAPRKEIRHAIDYNRELRKRLGNGGEAKWIGDRKRLKAAYVRTVPELDNLLEYYTKAVKFATSKPQMDIPEAV